MHFFTMKHRLDLNRYAVRLWLRKYGWFLLGFAWIVFYLHRMSAAISDTQVGSFRVANASLRSSKEIVVEQLPIEGIDQLVESVEEEDSAVSDTTAADEKAIHELVDAVYVISLTRRQDRVNSARETLKWLGVPENMVHIHQAYDKDLWGTAAFTSRLLKDFKKYVGDRNVFGDPHEPGRHFARRQPMTFAEFSVAVSHLSAISSMLEKGYERVLFLEDDVCPSFFTLDEDLPSLLGEVDENGWEAIMFGDCARKSFSNVTWTSTETDMGNFLIHEGFCAQCDYEEHITFNCLHAYAITARVARRLLSQVFPVTFPVDVTLPQLLLKEFYLDTYAFNRNLINQGRTGHETDVQADDGLFYELCGQGRTSKYGSCVDITAPRTYKIQERYNRRKTQEVVEKCIRMRQARQSEY